MASLRRRVEGWMGDILYERLGDEPCIDVAWQLLRDVVGQQLLGTEFVTVPFIDSASYFNQLFVFVKEQSFLNSLRLRPPTYKIVGNLDYLVKSDVSTWAPQFDFSPWDVADGSTMYRDYQLRITSNQVGVEKSIDLRVIEAHVRSAQPPVPGTLTIHRNLLEDLNDTKTLYVITDVVLANYVNMIVKIGNHQVVFVNDRDMPIGFKYRKFKMRNDGAFIAELNTTLKILQKEAIWLRPLPQPIPNVPLWDYMRRRYQHSLRRKTRNNLTIPTPTEVPDINIRGSRQGGAFRLDRFDVNGALIQARDGILVNPDRLLQGIPLDLQNRRVAHRATISMETLQGSD